jgi:hypothetical protein
MKTAVDCLKTLAQYSHLNMLKALVVAQFWWDTVTCSFRHYMHSYQPQFEGACRVASLTEINRATLKRYPKSAQICWRTFEVDQSADPQAEKIVLHLLPISTT